MFSVGESEARKEANAVNKVYRWIVHTLCGVLRQPFTFLRIHIQVGFQDGFVVLLSFVLLIFITSKCRDKLEPSSLSRGDPQIELSGSTSKEVQFAQEYLHPEAWKNLSIACLEDRYSGRDASYKVRSLHMLKTQKAVHCKLLCATKRDKSILAHHPYCMSAAPCPD